MTKIDELISRFKEFKEELNKNVNMSYSGSPNGDLQMAEAGPDPKVMISKKPLEPKDVSDAGAASFKIALPKGEAASSSRHPMSEDTKKSDYFDMIKYESNGQWSMEKAKQTLSAEHVPSESQPDFDTYHIKNGDKHVATFHARDDGYHGLSGFPPGGKLGRDAHKAGVAAHKARVPHWKGSNNVKDSY